MLGLGAVLCGTLAAGELSESDRKWGKVVEEMIQNGTEKISTTSSARADLAVELAKKHKRNGSIKKTDSGYEVTFQAAESGTTVAKSGK